MYSVTLENLKDMGKFSDAYNLPERKQDDMYNLNRYKTGSKSKAVIRALSAKMSSSRWIHWWVFPDLQRRINSDASPRIPQNIPQVSLKAAMLPNSFYEAGIIPTQKPHN